MAELQKSMQKMALVLEKLVEKVDELDRRVAQLQRQNAEEEQTIQKVGDVSKSNAAFSFLGSMAGAVAAMGLTEILFDDDIEPADVAQKLGLDTSALVGITENIEELDGKLEDIDKELEELLAQTEVFDDGISDEDFEQMSLDDYLASEGEFEDFDDV